LDQCVFAQDENRDAIQLCGDFAGKRFVGADPAYAAEQINSIRSASELDNLVRFGEIRFAESGVGETEFIQQINNLCCIFWCGPDQNAEIAGVTRAAMKRQTVRSHNDIFNAARV